YPAYLHEPGAGDAGDVTFPALAELYIDPGFRVRQAGPADRPADESWWQVEQRADLAEFLAAFLTTSRATEGPLLLLGQPGAGKSALTKVLAARLPAEDFLVVRVALREVPAERSIQDQIEFALRATIGRHVAWADLAATAGGAMPVILLDGFDELLQATGMHQSDFLKKVAAFQKREATLKRPAAIVVTSRVAVADRATIPENTLVVRLAGFDREQVGQWLATWNAANAPHGRPPLTLGAVERYPHLIEQPLLLLMLALHDAEETLRADVTLELADLYERLMVSFAEREVRRLHGDEPESAVQELIEEELRRLSVMAFAMFNRARLWITGQELDDDLRSLGMAAPSAEQRRRLTVAQEVVGRFFFLQRAQAIEDGRTLQAYEFLHATFEEYLVARLVAHEVRDGGMLRSLIGYEPLFAREFVPVFLHSMLNGRREAREWLMPALRQAVNRPEVPELDYRPVDRRADHWMALYSVNLALLVLACGEPLRASEMFPDAFEAAGELHRTAGHWGAAMERSVWGGLLDVMIVRRLWDGRRRDVQLEFGTTDRIEPVDPWWTHGREEFLESASPGTVVTGFTTPGHVAKSLHVGGGIGSDMMRHALEPLIATAPESLTTFVVHGDGTELTSVLHDAIALWTKSANRDPDLEQAYDRAIRAPGRTRSSGGST
ncbi:hypothetical protein AB0M20_13735, partial [Actinoplanes sp. NPDC051633]|uniref:NACHT domain-containing protein n=1 Tax=Actinoplanes sp. NPDC051633 TaxID=3155670 RepID=UPI00343F2D6F